MMTELEALLAKLREQHWTQNKWGRAPAPSLLAHWRQVGGCVDIALMFSEDDATAWRTPIRQGSDPWRPDLVWWWYVSSALYVHRAVLSLPEPGTRGAPHDVLTPHHLCRLPDNLPAPVITRPLGTR